MSTFAILPAAFDDDPSESGSFVVTENAVPFAVVESEETAERIISALRNPFTGFGAAVQLILRRGDWSADTFEEITAAAERFGISIEDSAPQDCEPVFHDETDGERYSAAFKFDDAPEFDVSGGL